jgi:uncharacterized protein (PEP-CTERM system associated)
LFLVLGLPLSGIAASKIVIKPSVVAEEVYTDNITLAAPGDERDDLVTDVSPGFLLSKPDGRVKLNLDYRLQSLFYRRETDRNTTHQKLRATMDTELVRKRFFIEGLSSIGQRTIGVDGLNAGDNIHVLERTNVRTARISPYFQNDFGGFASATARYTYETARYSSRISDSNNNSLSLDLLSGRQFRRMPWELRYNQESLNRENRVDTERETTRGNIRYHVNNSWSGVARGGVENYNSGIGRSNQFRDGTYWEVGPSWHPNQRLRIDFFYGNRSRSASVAWNPTVRTALMINWRDRTVGLLPGEVWKGSFSLRTRRTQWQLKYSESITTFQQLQFEGRYLDLDTGELVITPEPGQNVEILPVDIFSLIDEVFLRKRGQLSFRINGAKGYVTIQYTDEQREHLESDILRTVQRGDIIWSRKVGYMTTASLDLGMQRTQDDAGQGGNLKQVGAMLQRSARAGLEVALIYRYSARDDRDNRRNYTENQLRFQISKEFRR